MPSREELIETVDQYLNALVARDPAALQLAPAVKFTENCIPLPLGKGLWATATGLGAYKHYICDEYAGQAGFFGVIEEMGNPAIFAMRLKTEYRHITEIETLVARFGNPLYAPEALLAPRPVFDEIVPPEERSPRDELVRITNLYFDGIEQNDGSIIPLYPDAYRIENGVKTTSNESRRGGVGSLSIAEGISSGFFEYIPQIRDRRFPVVDEHRGLCLGFVYFEHPGNVKSVDVPRRGKLDLAPFTQKPSTAMIAELFKIRGGKIQAIDAILEFLPYGIKSGWD
ncbi:MAG TPA: hypothetical protein VI759_09885 [Dehalococcoidia bacterium]|nr:hypothetical protein [Dehalococcoidia bacterium]